MYKEVLIKSLSESGLKLSARRKNAEDDRNINDIICVKLEYLHMKCVFNSFALVFANYFDCAGQKRCGWNFTLKIYVPDKGSHIQDAIVKNCTNFRSE